MPTVIGYDPPIQLIHRDDCIDAMVRAIFGVGRPIRFDFLEVIASLTDGNPFFIEETLKVLLAPYRKEDVEEVMEILKSSGGVDKLYMAFYQQEDLGSDKVWDIWRVEGPSLVCHFRGAPHVHAYINIGVKA